LEICAPKNGGSGKFKIIPRTQNPKNPEPKKWHPSLWESPSILFYNISSNIESGGHSNDPLTNDEIGRNADGETEGDPTGDEKVKNSAVNNEQPCQDIDGEIDSDLDGETEGDPMGDEKVKNSAVNNEQPCPMERSMVMMMNNLKISMVMTIVQVVRLMYQEKM
jgi:hypothetical protein